VHCSCQQCLVAKWSGHSVTVRVRARGNENFPFLFILFVLKCDKRTLSWHGVITPQQSLCHDDVTTTVDYYQTLKKFLKGGLAF